MTEFEQASAGVSRGDSGSTGYSQRDSGERFPTLTGAIEAMPLPPRLRRHYHDAYAIIYRPEKKPVIDAQSCRILPIATRVSDIFLVE